jgi:hypothetical protein
MTLLIYLFSFRMDKKHTDMLHELSIKHRMSKGDVLRYAIKELYGKSFNSNAHIK